MGRKHLLGDVAALQSLDGKHHFPEAALGHFSPTGTAGHELSLAEWGNALLDDKCR